MQKLFYTSFILPIFLSIFISCFFIPIFQNSNYSNYNFSNSILTNPENILNISNSYYSNTFLWPTPNHSKITSYFGYRNAPTQGAGTYHGRN